MIRCPNCQAVYIDNTLFCSECGAYMSEDARRQTDPIGGELIDRVQHNGPEVDLLAPVDTKDPQIIYLKIEGGREIELLLARSAHLGRLDPATNNFPEVDLTDDGAQKKGVSRRHARLIRLEAAVAVEDLGSTNGTFVNGVRVAPQHMVALKKGDIIRCGQIELKFGPE